MTNKNRFCGWHHLVRMVALLSAMLALVACDDKKVALEDQCDFDEANASWCCQGDDKDAIPTLSDTGSGLYLCNAERVYESCIMAPSFREAQIQGADLYDYLGASIVDKGVNFAVYAKNATRVEVLIFDSNNPDSNLPLKRIPMAKNMKTGIWQKYV